MRITIPQHKAYQLWISLGSSKMAWENYLGHIAGMPIHLPRFFIEVENYRHANTLELTLHIPALQNWLSVVTQQSLEGILRKRFSAIHLKFHFPHNMP